MYRLKVSLTNHDVSKEEINKAMAWYQDAHNYATKLSNETGYSVAVCAGVISALSPACKWDQNKRDAANLLYKASNKPELLKLVTEHKPGTYGINIEKAYRILDCEDSSDVYSIFIGKGTSGFKTLAFFDNIFKPKTSESITIDRWMLRAYGLNDNLSLTSKRYRDISASFKRSAKRANMKPLVFQAVIWTIIRGAAQ